MRATELVRIGVAMASLSACGGGDASDGGAPPIDVGIDAGTDAGRDAGVDAGAADAGLHDANVNADSGATPAEQAACAQLATLAPCGPASMDHDACIGSFTHMRAQAGASCASQYDAWVDCVAHLSTCPSGSGVLCPDQYSALGACVMR